MRVQNTWNMIALCVLNIAHTDIAMMIHCATLGMIKSRPVNSPVNSAVGNGLQSNALRVL